MKYFTPWLRTEGRDLEVHILPQLCYFYLSIHHQQMTISLLSFQSIVSQFLSFLYRVSFCMLFLWSSLRVGRQDWTKMCYSWVKDFPTLIFSLRGNHRGAWGKQFSPPCYFQNNIKTGFHYLLLGTTSLPLKNGVSRVKKSPEVCCVYAEAFFFSLINGKHRAFLLLALQLGGRNEWENQWANALIIFHIYSSPLKGDQ